MTSAKQAMPLLMVDGADVGIGIGIGIGAVLIAGW